MGAGSHALLFLAPRTCSGRFRPVISWRSGFEASTSGSRAAGISAPPTCTARWGGSSRSRWGCSTSPRERSRSCCWARRSPSCPLFPTLCGVMAVIGHVYSVFVGFKGGKGVATAAGMLIGLAPCGSGAWLIGLAPSGVVHRLRLARLGRRAPRFSRWPTTCCSPARRTPADTGIRCRGRARSSIWKHRANIQRLLNGTENRFGRRRRPRLRRADDRDRRAGRRQLGNNARRLSSPARATAVRLWAYEPEVVEAINRRQENPVFLPGCRLAKGLRALEDRDRGGAGGRRDSLRGARAMWCGGSCSRSPAQRARGNAGGERDQGTGTGFAAADVGGAGAGRARRAGRGALRPQLRAGGVPGAADGRGGCGRERMANGRGHPGRVRDAALPGVFAPATWSASSWPARSRT